MFAAPAEATNNDSDTEFVSPRDLVGHLLILKPIEHKTSVQTKFGLKDGIVVDVADLSVTNPDGTVGKVHQGNLWMQGFIVGSLKAQIGQLVLAVIYTEPSTKGNDAYKLQDATANPQYVQHAEAWMNANPNAFSTLKAPVAQATPAPAVALPQPAPASIPAAAVPAPVPTPAAAPVATLDPAVLGQLDPAARQQLLAALGQPA